VIVLLIFVAVVAAAFGGYAIGARRLTAAASAAPTPPATDTKTGTDDDEGRFGAEKARIIRSRDTEAASLRAALDAETTLRIDDEELRRERERLFAQLADARDDSAHYRSLVVDIENNAPPPILSGAGEPDDLKLIVGIGPVLERMLHKLGVSTFRQIARWTPRDVVDFDARLPEFPGRIERDQWVTQARAMHESKYGAPPAP
jgi:predicted flap endonuclease-1-like 5' DNA nuclease